MKTTIAFVSGTIGMLTAFAIFCCGVYAGLVASHRIETEK